jgi:hypothetical protein
MNTVTPVKVTLEGLSFISTDPKQNTYEYIPTNTGRQTLPVMYTINKTGSVKVRLEAKGYDTESLEAEQSSKVTISKLTVTFTHASSGAPGANTVTPELTVSGSGNATYSRVTGQRTGRNPYTYTITYENVVFTGVSNASVVTASYTHQVTNNRGQVTHECTLEGSATVGSLISHPTIQMTAQ